MENVEIYLDIARSTEIFKPIEIDILKSILQDYCNNPDTSYVFFEEAIDGNILGFIVFGKIALTEFAWDIYWLAVRKSFQGKGVGKMLLRRVEEYIAQKDEKSVLRVETSARKEYEYARKLYIRQKFGEVGRIPNFYCEGDDLVTFCKEIRRN